MTSHADPNTECFDALIIGAGFSGMYMLHRLRELGLCARVYERGSDVGGTWYWNRYPGARCDVESPFYSYSFSEDLQQEWEWTQRYPAQPEILAYCRHVAYRFDLLRDIVFDTRVAAAEYDAEDGRWTVRTDRDERAAGSFLITAVGCLSAARIPDFPGLATFDGPVFHTGLWPHEPVDFTGKRVGVVGTGSSGIQSIPVIAGEADHVTVFQRTPNFSIPARNRPLDPVEQQRIKAEFPKLREEARQTDSGTLQHRSDQSVLEVAEADRREELDRAWEVGGLAFMTAFNDILTDIEANDLVADYVRERIRAAVYDPETADLLCPRDHPIGAKRICVDTDYYATYNRPNVSLVDVREAPIERITPTGLRAGEVDHELDSIVFATGYDAMTGPLNRIAIRGTGGKALRDKWAAGPRTYLGVATAGFPNLFTITGPGSPSVLSNMIVSIEQHVEWIADCIDHLRSGGFTRIEARQEAEDAWVEHVKEAANETLYPRAASWYLGANVEGKPRAFMPYVGGVAVYREHCEEVAKARYRGFELSR